MNKREVIKAILQDAYLQLPKNNSGSAFAPTNIALVKYWGKRNTELNLPMTSSLSISLGEKGAKTTLTLHEKSFDEIYLNNQLIAIDSAFAKKLIQFLDLFRVSHSHHFKIDIHANIPVAAGLASSACGFAALTQALNKIYGWNLSFKELSILARLGSGSACRSIWNGFVEWQAGKQMDGMDSHGESIDIQWPELSIGLVIMSAAEKKISSREAMQRTVETSSLYKVWPEKVANDLPLVKQAIAQKDFILLGKTAESNALSMHATMMSAWPPVSYALPETTSAMQQVWELRQQGTDVYFTQDAGPNLKLIFLKQDSSVIQRFFPSIEIIHPF